MLIDYLWYQKKSIFNLLVPFSWIYRLIIAIRKAAYDFGVKKIIQFPVPVIVIGNLTVGGTGKTPLVLALAEYLRTQGWYPGIVSRGYRGYSTKIPCEATSHSDPKAVGDEAVLLAQKSACPVFVCRQRTRAVEALLQKYPCNVIISDDGLQHLALKRNLEIAVIDGERRLGNNFCLPAGPLREPAKRLSTVDFVVNNGVSQTGEWKMDLLPEKIYQIVNPARQLTANDKPKITAVHAIAGIGNPRRFFRTLEELGWLVYPHAFPDHHLFQNSDFDFGNDALIIMTEKDAVKCKAFADERFWCLSVKAQLPPEFLSCIHDKLLKS